MVFAPNKLYKCECPCTECWPDGFGVELDPLFTTDLQGDKASVWPVQPATNIKMVEVATRPTVVFIDFDMPRGVRWRCGDHSMKLFKNRNEYTRSAGR